MEFLKNFRLKLLKIYQIIKKFKNPLRNIKREFLGTTFKQVRFTEQEINAFSQDAHPSPLVLVLEDPEVPTSLMKLCKSRVLDHTKCHQ